MTLRKEQMEGIEMTNGNTIKSEEKDKVPQLTDDLTLNLLNLLESTITGEKSMNETLDQLKSLKNPQVQSILFDIYAGLCCDSLTEEQNKKATALGKFLTKEFIPHNILECEVNQMGANELKGKMIKLRTRIYFKQTKFNLLREESEGYSKLLAELLSTSSDNVFLWTRITQLIGQFNLDPNRVVDLLLETFAGDLERKDTFLYLLRKFNVQKQTLKDMILVKFQFYERSGHTSNSFYRAIAILCVEKLVEVIPLYNSLSPTKDKLVQDSNSSKALLKKRALQAQKISTIAAMDLQNQSPSTSSALDGLGSSTNTQVSFELACRSQIHEDQKLAGDCFDEYEQLGKNQKLGFLLACFEIGSWSLAEQLFPTFPSDFVFGKSKRAREALTQILGYVIEPFYRLNYPSAWEDEPLTIKEWENFVEKPDRLGRWEDFETKVLPIAQFLGPHIGSIPEVAIKFTRLLQLMVVDEKLNANEETKQKTSQLVNELLDAVLIPSLTISEPMYKLGEEIWQILQHLPYHERYRMYGRWKSANTLPYYSMQLEKGIILGRVKYLMKRLSKDTVRVVGRQIGKLCLNHPTIALDYLLTQVQTFQNLIEPVVESLRYLSELAFDVLTYSLIENLADPAKQTLKTGDGMLSPWLSALASFTGAIYKRYTIEYGGLLQYVCNQLKSEKSTDLLVLREVITAIGCYEPITNLTQEQIDGMSGLDLLKQEVLGSAQVKANKKAVNRLKEALQNADLNISLAILISQQTECIVHKEAKEAPVKLACQVLDECHSTFIQFVNFMKVNMKVDEYSKRIPKISELLTTFNLSPDYAFHLTRSVYWHKALVDYDQLKKVKKEETEKKKVDADTKTELYKDSFAKILLSVEEEICETMPADFWTNISAKLFCVFWQLNISDLVINKNGYKREVEKIQKQVEAKYGNDASKKRQSKEAERLKALEAKLNAEQQKQENHVQNIRFVLGKVRESLFAKTNPSQQSYQQTTRFLQTCIIPRATFSEMDAIFSANFIFFLHEQRTGYFETIRVLDRIFFDINQFLAAFTESEASNFGKFLSLLLEKSLYWRSEKERFEKECEGFPGCLTKVRNADNTFDFATYQTVTYKWQMRLFRTVLFALQNGSYLMIRNAIVVMKKILNQFPLIKPQINQVEQAITAVRDKEKGKREDLMVMAVSYLTNLKKRKVQTFASNEEFAPGITPTKARQNESTEKCLIETSAELRPTKRKFDQNFVPRGKI